MTAPFFIREADEQPLPLTKTAIKAALSPVRRRITKRQRDVLAFIGQRVADDEVPPSLREIGAALGIRSTNGVVEHLVGLERKGFIRRGSMRSRDIVITDMGWDAIGVEPRRADLSRRTEVAVLGTAVHASLSPQAAAALDAIVASGFYGATANEVVERMICEKLREASQFLLLRTGRR